MAKDQITLLTNIAAEMKRQNQFSIRQNLENKEYQAAQLAQQSGDALEKGGGPELIDDATDFKRRVKASMFTAKMAEKITDSGKRAKDTVKENKEKEKQRKLDKKNGKLQRILKADKYVGQSSIVEAIEANDFSNSELTLSLIKVNSDAIVHSLGGIRHVLGMQSGNIDKARRAAIKVAKAEARDRADAKRDAEEARREAKDKIKDNAVIKVDANVKGDGNKKGGGLGGMLIAGALIVAQKVLSNVIKGWKTGGFLGAIKALFFGNGKGGIGNAIAGAFGAAATFATAGLLIGGPIGALVGGIVGLAVGGLTGWLGTEKIGKMMKGAGDSVQNGIWTITDKFASWIHRFGMWIYTPGSGGKWDPSGGTTKTKIFGQEINFGMPKFVSDIGDSIAGIWQGVKDFGTAIKNMVISLLPDSFTDHMGWTVKGKIPTKEPEKTTYGDEGMGYLTSEMALASQVLEKTKDSVSTYELAMQNYAAEGMDSLPKPDYADYMKIGFGSSHMGNLLNFIEENGNLDAAELKAKRAIAFPDNYSDKVLKQDKALIAEAEAKKKAEEAKKLMIKETSLNLLDDKITNKYRLTRQDGDGGKRWTPTYNTDASSNVGAVVVNNIYSLDQPIGPALISIHNHMDLNYGMSYNGW